MSYKRLIPCIFIYKGKAIKWFDDKEVVSDDVIGLAKQYCDKGADELIVFDLSNTDDEHDEAIDLMKAAAKATYGRKGDKIVQMNYDAIDAGAKQVVEIAVPESWKDAADEGLTTPHVGEGGRADVVDFVKNIQAKVNAQEGNTLPVSAFNEYVDGSTPPMPIQHN